MRLVLERFAHNALALLAVTTILFFMFRLMPGTPLAAFINENLNADQQQAMLEQFGLDKPMWQQYFIYLGNLLQGEMGLSFFQRRPVIDHPARGPAELGDPDADLADHRLHLRRAGRRLARLEARQLDRARRGAGRAGDARRARVLDRHGAAGAAVASTPAGSRPAAPAARGWPTPTTGSASPRGTTSTISRCRCSPSPSTCRACRCC